MAQHVILVDEVLVEGSIEMAGSMAGLSVSEVADAGPAGVPQQLQLRRRALGALAASLLAEPVAAAAGAGVASAAAMMMEEGVSPAADWDDERIQVLEGVSAIVVDDDVVDVASLQGVVGLSVFPNVELELPAPVGTEASGDAEPWHLESIGLDGDRSGGAGILIGILDTGIDAGHPEFAGKRVHFAEFDRAGRLVSTTPRDAGDHGTHVSSIAAGAQAGVAPEADLAVAAVLTIRDAAGRMSGTLVQIVNGFNWLVTQRFRGDTPGVDIVNASLGGPGFHRYLQNAVRTAFRLGIPMVAAIGNAGRGGAGRHGSPGNYPEVLGVGATDAQDVVAEFSDWAVGGPPDGPVYPVPDLCAPGVDVIAAKPGGGYQAMSGTSMATPVVAGVAARRMSSNSNLVGRPSALFASLESRLAPATAHRLGNLGGAGRIVA